MRRRIIRPSPTVAISALALVITFSGVAGALPGKNKVDGGDVKKDSLTGKDIKESTLKLPATAVAGALRLSVYSQAGPTLGQNGTANQSGGATVACPAGKQAVAGGGLSDATSARNAMTDSRPAQGQTGATPGAIVQDGQSFNAWRTYWNNDDNTASVTPVAYVVCAG